MARERRVALGYHNEQSDEPGIAQQDDGTFDLIAPDGARTDLGNGGAPFNGGTITEGLEIDGAGQDLALLAVLGGAAQSRPLLAIRDASESAYLLIDPTTGVELSANPVAGRSALNLSETALTFKDENGDILFDVEGGYLSLGATGSVVVFPAGALVINNHAEPAADTLGAGDCALWFDHTDGPGNTKLMIKGKSADGTVKTAAIILA